MNLVSVDEQPDLISQMAARIGYLVVVVEVHHHPSSLKPLKKKRTLCNINNKKKHGMDKMKEHRLDNRKKKVQMDTDEKKCQIFCQNQSGMQFI